MSQTPLTQNTPYTLFYVPDSANLVVRIALEELGASFAALLVEGAGAASRDAAFLALNPQGLVPVLVDSHQDEPLFETAAILLHLSEQHIKRCNRHMHAPAGVISNGCFSCPTPCMPICEACFTATGMLQMLPPYRCCGEGLAPVW
jgi:Glutathione S-transferase, N-terminal domain